MQKDSKKEEKFKIAYAISLVTQIGVTVSFITILFIGLGYKIDKYLDTLPIFVIIGAILAFVFSMFTVYRLASPVIKKNEEEDKPASTKTCLSGRQGFGMVKKEDQGVFDEIEK